MKLKIANASDIHGMWGPHPGANKDPKKKPLDISAYPVADFLIFAGDILGNYSTCRGDYAEVARQLNELEALNELCGELKDRKVYKEIFFTAGNHDWCFEKSNKLCRDRMDNLVYLQDEAVNVGTPDGGIIKIYGSPYTPWFWNWAFNFPDHNHNFFRARAHARRCWDQIPADTQILITHGPPHGILDETDDGMHVGCTWLKERLQKLMHLKLHVFGHIHPSRGIQKISNTSFVNASICKENYEPTNPIQVVEIDV